jgi:two-component system, NtrC family, sensor kinase
MASNSNLSATGLAVNRGGNEIKSIGKTPLLIDNVILFADSVPWPVIVVSESGDVVCLNAAMRAAGPALPAAGPRALRALYPHYFAALKGEPCWLTQQEVTVSRSVSPSLKINERLWVRRLPVGAYLIVMDETRLHHLESAHAQTARLASLGFMLATVSHEISNPLAAMHSILQVLQSQKASSPDTLDKGLRNIASSVRRILAITRKLNVFARVGNIAAAPFPIDSAIEEAATLFGYDSLGETTELRHEPDPAAWVFGQADHVQQIFHNIFLNAAQAMHGKGTISVQTRILPQSIEVAIRDNGPGIAPDALAKVFDPFFTTKPSGEGTGLGLAISHEIAHEHDGAIRAENHPDGGAIFIVTLPRYINNALTQGAI